MISLMHTSDSGNQQAEASIHSLLFSAPYRPSQKLVFGYLMNDTISHLTGLMIHNLLLRCMSDDKPVL